MTNQILKNLKNNKMSSIEQKMYAVILASLLGWLLLLPPPLSFIFAIPSTTVLVVLTERWAWMEAEEKEQEKRSVKSQESS